MTGSGLSEADLRTAGEKIQEIAPRLLPRPGEEVFNISGKLLTGVIDAHPLLSALRNSVTADDATPGAGPPPWGATTVLDYADQLPGALLDGITAGAGNFRMRHGLQLSPGAQ